MIKRLILASASPRRSELLEKIGLSFEIDVSDVDESSEERDPARLVAELSERKALPVLSRHGDCVVLAADTVVYSDDIGILGKPKNREDAERMLSALSGKRHSVFTGVTVADGDGAETRVCRTDVYFREIGKEEIYAYLDTGEYEGKAGGYAVQGLASVFTEKLDGDYPNVVGLPVCTVAQMLKKKGINVL